MFSLYKNRGSESFADVAHANGIAQATRLLSGWGLKFFDYDNDGNLDLLLANGHPDDMIENYSTQVKYAEPLLLFHNDGGKLRDVSKGAGPSFERSFPARGLAVGDMTNKGRLDVVISNNSGARRGRASRRAPAATCRRTTPGCSSGLARPPRSTGSRSPGPSRAARSSA
jgi:hypothetical protein